MCNTHAWRRRVFDHGSTRAIRKDAPFVPVQIAGEAGMQPNLHWRTEAELAAITKTTTAYSSSMACLPPNSVKADMSIENATTLLLYKLPAGSSRRALFMLHNRKFPHFKNPTTFNEKVNWRILYDRRPILEWTCDKLAMKERARNVPGLQVPRTLWARLQHPGIVRRGTTQILGFEAKQSIRASLLRSWQARYSIADDDH